MKKNISINISGIIFHIEEDGYETLKKYLDSINKYFSTFEDSSEILADIESRIAEIFLSKLNEEKQVITVDDVNSLVTTMGSVSDFRAVEEQEEIPKATAGGFTSTDYSTNQENTSSSNTAYTYTPPKQMHRDQKRKILGGVCSGLANYFNVDALWIRLIFAVLTFAYGVTFIVYIVMWILVPGSYDLDEPVVGKKMYRDPERKVIGGVSGGVAAYLGIDLIIVRVLFIIMAVFGGLGLFVYIVLWIVLPEARTLTDKMQMQGEPVTLSNIESSLKKSQSEKTANEDIFTKIVLFPFRLIGIILNGLGKALGPLVEVVRVIVGVFIVFTGIAFVLGMVALFATALFVVPWVSEMNEVVNAFLRAFPTWLTVASAVATIVPGVFVILLGVSVIAKRIVFNAAVGWSLFVLFFISSAIVAVQIPSMIFSFKEEGKYVIENTYQVTGKTAVLNLNEMDEMENYDAANLTLKGHAEPYFRVVQTFESQGVSRSKAIENAKMVEYHIAVNDSVFTFDNNLIFKPNAIFRAQRVDVTLFIPYNAPFRMDEPMARFITNYVDGEYLDGNTWKMTENGLECISCPVSENTNTANLSDFDELEIRGKFDVRIISGDSYNVELIGSEEAKTKYDIEQTGETLIIQYHNKKDFDWKLKDLKIEEVEIKITMPNLEKIEATGVGDIRVDKFTNDNIDIELRGPIKLRGDLDAHKLDIHLTGSSEADLTGNVNNLNARIELASKLDAYGLEVHDAFVETSGASKAKVNVSGTLEMDEGTASKIDYRGRPEIIRKD
ncbi:PspC domain-containing protein [Chryseosolibacter indicus]|uniref:PspC domain-containing protein n=1 Tax=Chryseosolibacter indicus TaxID=2782351 RepID=A0ABS5VLP1_9BACT|nr:PspC domain-containing protein [Chryseosolibacter indicus]MBT1702370.1 PspC domain-containing protein [Chryseosolibacter indicus]